MDISRHARESWLQEIAFAGGANNSDICPMVAFAMRRVGRGYSRPAAGMRAHC
jgi:hypothetical protein